MGYEIYVDGRYAASFASGWDEAAAWIEKHTANRTPLRRLAELGETHLTGDHVFIWDGVDEEG